MARPRFALALLALGEFLGISTELVGDILEELDHGRSGRWLWRQVLGLYGCAVITYLRQRTRLSPGLVALVLGLAMLGSASLASANRVVQAWLSIYYVTGTVSLLATMASQAMGAADRRARRIGVSALVFLLAAAGAVGAQPIPAGMKVGLAMYLQAGYGGLKQELLEAAREMPEADFAFKPAAAPEMRTYGQLFAHVAEGQFDACAGVKGVTSPVQGRRLERELTTKTEFVRALEDSFAFCDDVFASLTEQSANQLVKVGQGEIARSAVAVGILAHDSEMYGIATVYLRGKNLVPPSTRRQSAGPATPR